MVYVFFVVVMSTNERLTTKLNFLEDCLIPSGSQIDQQKISTKHSKTFDYNVNYKVRIKVEALISTHFFRNKNFEFSCGCEI